MKLLQSSILRRVCKRELFDAWNKYNLNKKEIMIGGEGKQICVVMMSATSEASTFIECAGKRAMTVMTSIFASNCSSLLLY